MGHRLLIALTWTLISFQDAAPAEALSPPDERLPIVLENVRNNEQLFRNLNIECYLRETYTLVTKDVPPLPLHRVRQATERSVLQDGLFYYSREGTTTLVNGDKGSMWSYVGYDGHMSRETADEKIANLYLDKKDENRLVNPHNLLIREWTQDSSLSDYLAKHSDVNGFEMNVSAGGIEEVDGLTCRKVHIEVVNPKWEKPLLARTIWLAQDRNYLPIKAIGFTPNQSAVVPSRIAHVEEMREITSGVWMPWRLSVTTYDLRKPVEGRASVLHEVEREIREIKLNPNYPISFFREIPFKEGIRSMSSGTVKSSRATERARTRAARLKTKPGIICDSPPSRSCCSP